MLYFTITNHHNGNQHWVLSTQLSHGEIYLLDGLALNITTSLEYQLAQIYGENRKNKLIKLPE
jgi:predicted transglutaminase-like cysteine proteinase